MRSRMKILILLEEGACLFCGDGEMEGGLELRRRADV